jgi:hypothetical protein
MTCICSTLNFLIYEENFIFFFISASDAALLTYLTNVHSSWFISRDTPFISICRFHHTYAQKLKIIYKCYVSTCTLYIPFSQDWTIFELYISSRGKKRQSSTPKNNAIHQRRLLCNPSQKQVSKTNNVFLLFLKGQLLIFTYLNFNRQIRKLPWTWKMEILKAMLNN